MSAYRSYYDYRKNYDTRKLGAVGGGSDIVGASANIMQNAAAATIKTSSKSPATKKGEDKADTTAAASKYTPSYRRFLQPATSATKTPTSALDSKISKEMREKYGPEGYTPKTEPPDAYHSSRKDSTSRLGIGTNHSIPRSRGTSPITGSRTEIYSPSSYTPYRTQSNCGSMKLKDTSNTQRGSREDLTRLGNVISNLSSNISRYRTTSTRGSRDDLTRLATTPSSSRTTRDSLKTKTPTTSTSAHRRNSREELNKIGSISRRCSREELNKIDTSTNSAVARRNSRDELNKLGTIPVRYTGSTSLNRYSTIPTKSEKGNTYINRKTMSPMSIASNYGPSYSRSTSQEPIYSKAGPVDETFKAHRDESTSVASTTDSSVATLPTDIIFVTVITRGTSPNLPTQPPYTRSKRSDVARVLQKDITVPKIKPEMIDKEVQSDRTDDTARYSRFGSARMTGPTPWSSYLDLKFSSPTTSYSKYSRSGSGSLSTTTDSNSTYNSNKTSSYSGMASKGVVDVTKERTPDSKCKSKIEKLDLSKSKSRKSIRNICTTPNSSSNLAEKDCSDSSQKTSAPSISTKSNSDLRERSSPIKLPPTVPKTSSSSASLKVPTSPHSLEPINKDFRKSTLNMNQYSKQKNQSKSSVVSSSDSEPSSTRSSPIKNNGVSIHSKNKVILFAKSPSRSRSTSSESSASSIKPDSNSIKVKNTNSHSDLLDDKSISETSKSESRTSMGISEIVNDTTAKGEEIKFKHKIRPIDSDERPWWLTGDKSENDDSKAVSKSDDVSKPKYIIRPVESGERAWWLSGSTENSANKKNGSLENVDQTQDNDPQKKVENKTSDSSTSNGKKYRIKPIESGERAWWLDDENMGETDVKYSKDSTESQFVSCMDDEKPRIIRPIESGERAWWLKTDSDSKTSSKKTKPAKNHLQKLSLSTLGHAASGEKAWWLESSKNMIENGVKVDSSDEEDSTSEELENYVIVPPQDPVEPLGDRLSPDGIEAAPEDELYTRNLYGPQFISKHTNIDDLLNIELIKEPYRIEKSGKQNGSSKLDDSALQLYKDGDYGAYLDLEASISEQQEEFDGFQDSRKNSIVLRTQLSVRVHSIIEKLLNSESRDLRRSLFSLKQIFQEDKDLVHEFVQNDGLSCLIKVGTQVDQNYQNYILRALGQLMLYVDGMNGVMEHNLTVQWLYSLIASKFRLVVKTALKLLLVFVEYVEANCILLIKAITAVDKLNGVPAWTVIMRLLKDYDSVDTELLIYATTLINKCLNGIPDQDTYYDQVDSLEEQGIESVIQRYMSRQGTDLDLLRQFQIYEAVLEHEDGEQKNTPLDEAIRTTLRNRKAVPLTCERRKSRRHSTGTASLVVKLNNRQTPSPFEEKNSGGEDESSSSQSSHGREHLNGTYNDNKETNQAGVTPALRRRRERAERQRSFIREQETAAMFGFRDENKNAGDLQPNNSNDTVKHSLNRGTLASQLSGDKLGQSIEQEVQETNSNNCIKKKPWVLSMIYSKSHEESSNNEPQESNNTENTNQVLQLNKENSVKDLTQKLSSQNILHSPPIEDNRTNRIGDMTGLIFKAKEGLAKSKSKIDVLRSPTGDNIPKFTVTEVKKTESELHWEELANTINRQLNLCDLDFTDLVSGDEMDVLAPSSVLHAGPPPPPPPSRDIPPMAPPSCPPVFSSALRGINKNDVANNKNAAISNKKVKKTVKLFWKEVRDDPMSALKLQPTGGMIWDELKPIAIDTQKLEHLFESRAKDSLTKKQQELNKNKEIIVLDHKRSNAINIGMTKLPPPRSIKTAILKMDATIMNREGIEKLLTMLPTEEERTRIQDAQATNPDLPLGSAEQFLLTLASISELPARLRLWAFKLDFESSEREIAEPLMDLKQGIELLKINRTFRGILSTLLSIGIFLNGSDVKGFQIDYLSKVPEVKDTVHKHSLLHHLCYMVMEKFPESTDLYSEIGAITRVSKVDFDELRHNIQRLEIDCKASWDHLKLIAKHDGTTFMKVKMSDFLADCAERIILLTIIHRRVINRYHRFLLWVGVPLHQIADKTPNEFCRIVSEFALEYRTTRERVLQQLEKKANHRERNKTRGKMITEVGKFSSKEERAEAELRHVLGTSDISDLEGGGGTLPWRRRREQPNRLSAKITLNGGGDLTDADDEIIESLVKTATKAPSIRTMPRERKRTRNVDRKSIKRSRTRESMYGIAKESP